MLNKLNNTYIIGEIIKLKYENLVFFIYDNSKADIIPKTIVFVNDIKNAQHIIMYFYLKILFKL